MAFFQTQHRTPIFHLSVSTESNKTGQDLTALVGERLIQLSLMDNRGFEADELEIQLSDHDGLLALPSRGAKIKVALGFKGESLIHKGDYVVDEIQYSGSPDSLTLRAKSADLKGSLHSKKERSFHNINIGKLIDQLALENNLKAQCAQQFKNTLITHLDQTNESTISFLSRLAQDYDAIATVKNGYLLFIPTGTGKTASGKALPPTIIRRANGDQFTFSLIESDNYTAVRAYWHNLDNGKKGEVIFDENSRIEKKNKLTKGRKRKDGTITGQKMSQRKYNVLVQAEPVESNADQMKTLRHTYQSEDAALNAAKSAFDKIQRGVATFSLTLAIGNPELIPEMPVQLQGFKGEIGSTNWIISKVSHNLSDSGFTSQVELELKLEE
ncbi:phage tail protein [Chelonobacter oris]|uniref:phage late control D family protein n=1 Tax=Chelonobacter oris TaxID=505317 RepID=UPI002448EDBC|nr:phage late control D family protein [Chelonobacter oris]MDH3000950.1 phage tail protein [Chelonobacter oris]